MTFATLRLCPFFAFMLIFHLDVDCKRGLIKKDVTVHGAQVQNLSEDGNVGFLGIQTSFKF